MLPFRSLIDWPTLAAILGLGIAAGVAMLALRRVLAWVLGPIFVWETVRLARKGHTFWLRVAFAVLMLGLLYAARPRTSDYLLWQTPVGLTPNQWDYLQKESGITQTPIERFAAEFSQSFLLVLVIAMTLITPLYLATAISEEKEKRTLDFLLATHLSSYEIVVGKLAARLLNLFGLLLAALPILALTQLWGGVDWQLIVEGFAIIAVATVSYGCAGVFCSVLFARTRNAVIATYVIALGFNCLCCFGSPVWQIRHLGQLHDRISRPNDPYLISAITFHLVALSTHLVSISGFLFLSVSRFRKLAIRHSNRQKRVLRRRAKGSVLPPHPLTIAANPPIRDEPLVWKERYLGRTFGGWVLNNTAWVYAYFLLGILLVLTLALAWDGKQELFADSFGQVMRVVTVVLGLAVLLAVSLRMAASVSREREQQTMESLLTLPATRREVLWAKWLGAFLRSRRALIGLGLTFLISGLVLGVHPLAWMLLPMLYVCHVWFFGNLGLFLSVVCPSTNRAYTLLLGILLGICATAWTISYFTPRETKLAAWGYRHVKALVLEDHEGGDVDDWLSPPQTCWRLMAERYYIDPPSLLQHWYSHGYSHDSHGSPWTNFVAAGVWYFSGGTVLWFLSLLRFRREGARR